MNHRTSVLRTARGDLAIELPDEAVRRGSSRLYRLSADERSKFNLVPGAEYTFSLNLGARRGSAIVEGIVTEAKEQGNLYPVEEVPEVSPAWISRPSELAVLEALERRARAGQIPVAFLVGKPGTGKTTLAKLLAAKTRRPFTVVDAPVITQRLDWFGDYELRNGETRFNVNPFVRLLEAGGAVICIDEINRVEDRGVWGPLAALLDGRHQIYVGPLGRTVTVAPNTLIIATANVDSGSDGTVRIHEYLDQRLTTVIRVRDFDDHELSNILTKTGLGQPECEHVLEIYRHLLKMSESQASDRISKPIGVRHLLEFAENVTVGRLPVRQAFEVSVLNHYPTNGDSASERFQVEQMVRGKWPELFDIHKGGGQ